MLLFAILKQEETKQIFTAKNYTEAQVYFKAYIEKEQYKIDYNLFKIGDIDKNLIIKPEKFFISNGYSIGKKIEQKETINQIKLKIEKAKDKATNEALKILFEGKYING